MNKLKILLAALLSAAVLLLAGGCEYTDEILDDALSRFLEEYAGSTAETVSGAAPETVGTGVATPVKLSEIPKYSGSPFAVVGNNIPNFSVTELSVIGVEKYSELDYFGRCGAAFALCGRETMPKDGEKRGNISSIKPTGWVQKFYDFVDGEALYNRAHLIGWQLSAENANARNLITGTRYMNVQGMLPFENMIADYIKETGGHVAYRATPIFDGKNLVCHGVQLEAYSVEDGGESVCFNVFCYNVQPGVKIDYTTGKNSLDKN